MTVACDDLDRVADGINTAPGLCTFDPCTLIGQAFTCTNSDTNGTVTTEAAAIALVIDRSSHDYRKLLGIV